MPISGLSVWCCNELLTGRQLFEGEDVSETLAQVLTKQPDLESVPLQSRRLLRACLEKDPKLRLRDIGDAAKLLDFSPESPELNLDVRKRPRQWVPWTAAAVALGLALSLVWIRVRETGPSPERVQFQIFPRDQYRLGGFQVSPDGRQVAFVETDGRGVGRLQVRALDSLETRVLAEQSTAVLFWSPDSKYVAFMTDRRLRKVDIFGGGPQTITDVAFAPRGGAWSRNGTILLGGTQGLWSVPDRGGSLSQVTAIDFERQENSHAFPSFLPDGRRFLYLRRSTESDNSGIYLGDLNARPGEHTAQRLVATETGAAVSNGHLLFLREDILVAQPFDVEAGVLTGEAMTIVEPVGSVLSIGLGLFSVSDSGTLVYRTGRTTQTRPVWFERPGIKSSPIAEPGDYGELALSRDGSRLALTHRGRTWDIEVVDLARGSSMRLTFDGANESNPVWSPDKKQVAFFSSQKDSQGIHVKASDGTRDEEILISSGSNSAPNDWSPDGNYLLYTRVDPKTAADLWLFSVKDRKSKPFLATKASEGQGQISNDGRFVAYTSDQSGRAEIYVRTFPDGEGPWQVSRGGGVEPRWRGDDKELFFRVLNNRPPAAVDVFRDPIFRVGPPQMWFNSTELASFLGAGGVTRNPRWAPTPDGKRIIAVMQENQEILSPLTVVTHWQTGSRK
ncbi:MAG TPA: hypothetical protein VKK06_08100 [Terriglobia bacterium]|nr:hypothetical protein [Terriglobia bacterium]